MEFWNFGSKAYDRSTNLPTTLPSSKGITVAVIISLYLTIQEGKSFFLNVIKVDKISILGGVLLTTAFVGFIYSISHTTAAVTLFMLALMPFLASLIAFVFIKEKISLQNFISMIVALGGTLE